MLSNAPLTTVIPELQASHLKGIVFTGIPARGHHHLVKQEALQKLEQHQDQLLPLYFLRFQKQYS